MRSHAKASTAGSNRQQAAKLALPASVFAGLLAVVLLAGNASAANGVTNFFGANGTQGGQFGSANSGPGGVAVNQEGSGGATAGDVYVVDRGNNRVQQFTAAGAFVRAFGLNVGGVGVHVCEAAASCVAGTASAEAGGMSNPQGIAIDQTNGNVFVSDQTNRRIDVFSANGTFQAAFGYGVDTGAAALELCTTASTCAAGSSGANAGQFGAQIGYLAIAPAASPNAGHLYVANKSNRRVDQFEPTLTGSEVTGIAFVKGWGWGVDSGASEFQQCTTASVCQAPNTSSPTSNPGQFGSNQPQALAVDSNGNLYTAESAGNNRAQKFDSSGNPAAFAGAELTGSPGPNDIAVDKTNNRVYALKEVSGTNEKRVLEFNSAGALIATHASGTTITSANGLAQVQGTTNFYVSTSQSSEFRGVFFLGTKVNPTATVEAPSPLTSSSATLKGTVNPQGFTTSYRFEFSRDNGSTWEKVPASDVNLGNGTSAVPVSQEVSGLVGGSSYRYKIVATKPFGAGTATSSTQIFSAPASAPTVPATFTTAVTTKTAVLGAEINPQNQASTYHFEYGTADCSANPCTSIPATDAGIGSSATPVGVAKEISGLQPGTTYHYRVVATNGSGTSEGPDTTFNTYAEFAPDTNCPNQEFRNGASANLPDCRAYEMVSPVDKNGADAVYKFYGYFQGSDDGNGITYSSHGAFGNAVSSRFVNQYLSRRDATGWSTDAINAPSGRTLHEPLLEAIYDLYGQYEMFTPDLSSGWLRNDNVTLLAPGAAAGYPNIYRRDNLTASFEALTTPPSLEALPYPAPTVQAHSADFEHVIFAVRGALTPDAAVNEKHQIYDYHDGEPHLVSVLPDGTADPENSGTGSTDNDMVNGTASVDGAMSDDGSRIFWTSGRFGGSQSPRSGVVYLRENPTAAQSALAAGAATGTGDVVAGESTIANVGTESGAFAVGQSIFGPGIAPGTTIVAVGGSSITLSLSAMGTKAGAELVSSSECTEPQKACTVPVSQTAYSLELNSSFWAAARDGSKALFSTSDANKRKLYEFDVESRTATLLGTSVGGVVAASDNLSHVYFTSEDNLAPGGTAGEWNIYLDQDGSLSFVANVAAKDTEEGTVNVFGPKVDGLYPYKNASRVTPDGHRLVFLSRSSELAQEAAGYDTTDAVSGESDMQVYAYEVGGEVQCVSCNPSGARPHGAEVPQGQSGNAGHVDVWTAGWFPARYQSLYWTRVLSDDGNRIFFNSLDALLPQDTNGVQDVYMWQAAGTGSCQAGSSGFSASNGGCISLISTGESSAESVFVDASPSGDDVFLSTESSLVPQDPGLGDLYDARVDGGFAVAPAPPECLGDACQSVPAAPNDATPASASFRGAQSRSARFSADCGQRGRQAAKLRLKAKRLQRQAARGQSPKRSQALRKRSEQIAKRARSLSQSAARCRRANRRAGR